MEEDEAEEEEVEEEEAEEEELEEEEVFLGYLPTQTLEEDAQVPQDLQLIPITPANFPCVEAAPALARIALPDQTYHLLLTPPDVEQYCFSARRRKRATQRKALAPWEGLHELLKQNVIALKARVHGNNIRVGVYLRSTYRGNGDCKDFFCDASMMGNTSCDRSFLCSLLQDVIEWICEDAANDLPESVAALFGASLRVTGFYMHLHEDHTKQEIEGSAPWLDDPLPLPTQPFYTPGWPGLTEYQQKSIAWMLWRERQGGSDVVSPVWTPLPHNPEVLYNRTTGKLACKCDYDQYEDKAADICGGILADAPGLGKTCMVLTVVALTKHFRRASAWAESGSDSNSGALPQKGIRVVLKKKEQKEEEEEEEEPNGSSLICVGCRGRHPIADSCAAPMHPPSLPFMCKTCCPENQNSKPNQTPRATIIVVPESLLMHWVDEIRKVLQPGSLKAVVYPVADQEVLAEADENLFMWSFGQQHVMRENRATIVNGCHGNDGVRWHFEPRLLARMDLVLTTLETLHRESRVQSPLNEEHLWWRVVLDESQDCKKFSFAKLMSICSKLQAVCRWAVSGTPLTDGSLLRGETGQLQLLQVPPFFKHEQWWCKAIADPCKQGDRRAQYQFVTLFSRIMRRTCRNLLTEQAMGIKELKEHSHSVPFTPLEHDYYQIEHAKFATLVRNCQQKGDKCSLAAVKRLSNCLMKLQKFCCMPMLNGMTNIFDFRVEIKSESLREVHRYWELVLWQTYDMMRVH